MTSGLRKHPRSRVRILRRSCSGCCHCGSGVTIHPKKGFRLEHIRVSFLRCFPSVAAVTSVVTVVCIRQGGVANPATRGPVGQAGERVSS
jgi:hypothetical protein